MILTLLLISEALYDTCSRIVFPIWRQNWQMQFTLSVSLFCIWHNDWWSILYISIYKLINCCSCINYLCTNCLIFKDLLIGNIKKQKNKMKDIKKDLDELLSCLSLIPPLFIKVSVPNQESEWTLGVSILSLFLLCYD